MGNVFELRKAAFHRRWRRSFDHFRHKFIEFGRFDAARTVFIHFNGFFDGLKNPLFVVYRDEQDRNVVEWRKFVLDGCLVVAGRVGFLRDQVPFIHQNDDALVAFLSQAQDVEVLRFQTAFRIQHHQANVGFFHGTNSTHHGVEFQVFFHFGFFADTGGIDQDKFLAEFVVRGVNRVAGGTCNGCYDVSLFPQQGIHQRGFAHIRTSDDGKLGQCGFQRFFIFNMFHHGIQQVACAAAAD